VIHIELDQEKAEMFREILLNNLSGLKMEIAGTKRREFRNFLKKREELLEEFLLILERELAAAGKEMVDIDRLRNVDIFQGLTDWELKTVAQFLEEMSVPEKVTLCIEGERADNLFILEEGGVSVRFRKGDSYEINIQGRTVGWSFLVPPNIYTATAVTITPCKLLVLKSPDFYYLMHKEPKMGMVVMDNLARVVASRMKARND
jgi:hypothetical protein